MVSADARIILLLASAAGHLGAYQLSTRLLGPSPGRALAIFQHWGRRACAWLRLDVQVYGAPRTQPCLYLCNHRSYLDIPLLAAVLGASFMSRADVATWPLVGAAATAVGVVFVERDDPYGRARAARALARRAGSVSMVVFPEGTTRGERLPCPLQPGLFQLLHRLDTRVVPVTIRYSDRRVYWTDDSTLPNHLRARVLVGPRLTAAVHLGKRISKTDHPDADSLARAVYEAICRPIEQFGELV